MNDFLEEYKRLCLKHQTIVEGGQIVFTSPQGVYKHVRNLFDARNKAIRNLAEPPNEVKKAVEAFKGLMNLRRIKEKGLGKAAMSNNESQLAK